MKTDLEQLVELEHITKEAINALEARVANGSTPNEMQMVLFQLDLEKKVLALIQILKNKSFRK